MNTNQDDSGTKEEKNTLDEVIKQQAEDFKENPKKTILIFLWNILWYAVVIMLILYIVSYPYQCEYEGQNYPPTRFHELQNKITENYQANPLGIQPEPTCNYDITRIWRRVK